NSTTLAPLPKNFELRISNCEMQSTPGSTKLTVLQIRISKSAIRNSLWRRGWDSNPRWALTHSGFRDRCTNPLCDLSAIKMSEVRDQKSEETRFSDPRPLNSDVWL